MIDITPEVVQALDKVLPTSYEMFLDNQSQSLPCISYSMIENADQALGNDRAWSRITYKIKIWCNEVSNITTYMLAVDDALATLGRFHRNGVQDIRYGDLICRIMDYTILTNEIFETSRYSE